MPILPEVSYKEIASQTENYSGADLQALLYNSQLEAIHQSLPNITSINNEINFLLKVFIYNSIIWNVLAWSGFSNLFYFLI